MFICGIADFQYFAVFGQKKMTKRGKNFCNKIWKWRKSLYLCAPVRLGRDELIEMMKDKQHIQEWICIVYRNENT